MGDAACGCDASVDNSAECDCQMQSACFCDATCTCSYDVCETAEH